MCLMKKSSIIILVLLLALVGCVSCENRENNETKEMVEIEKDQTEEPNEVRAESSGFLDSGDGFNYEAKNVLDGDLATAWCREPLNEDSAPFAGVITLIFPESPAGKLVGIVPGFAADEKIYWQNNRVKKLVLVDPVSPMLDDATVFELKDQYGMQYFELPEKVGEMLTFSVAEVYPGSKYNDTCIAEFNFQI